MEKILFLTVAIKSVAIDYCNKNFVAVEFGCNEIFLLLLKILYYKKKILLLQFVATNMNRAFYDKNREYSLHF